LQNASKITSLGDRKDNNPWQEKKKHVHPLKDKCRAKVEALKRQGKRQLSASN